MEALTVPRLQGGERRFQRDDQNVRAVIEPQLEQGCPEILTEIGGIPDNSAWPAEVAFQAFPCRLEDLTIHGLVPAFAGDFLPDPIKGNNPGSGGVLGDPFGLAGAGRPPEEDQFRGRILDLPGAGDSFFQRLNQPGLRIADRLLEGMAAELTAPAGEGVIDPGPPVRLGIRIFPETQFLTAQPEQIHDFQLFIQIRTKASLEVGNLQGMEQGRGALPGQLPPAGGRGIILDEAAGIMMQMDEGEHGGFDVRRQSQGGEAQAQVVPPGFCMAGGHDALLPIHLAAAGGERFADIMKNGRQLQDQGRSVRKKPPHLFQDQPGVDGDIPLAMPDGVLRRGPEFGQQRKNRLPCGEDFPPGRTLAGQQSLANFIHDPAGGWG